jgi:hypothetical protein
MRLTAHQQPRAAAPTSSSKKTHRLRLRTSLAAATLQQQETQVRELLG